MSVPGTYRPPYGPKCPPASGVGELVRMLCFIVILLNMLEFRCPNGLNEGANLGRVLAAGRTFETRAGVDAPRPRLPYGLGHVVRAQTAGQNDSAGQAAHQAPIEGAAGSAALGTGGRVDEKGLGAAGGERG